MQKQSFQHLPLTYRPYDFPTALPILAFLGDNWKNTITTPEFLHFHNGLEIGCCLSGSGEIYCDGIGTFSYHAKDYSIIFPQLPHATVSEDSGSAWEYLYIEPGRLLQKHGASYQELWQIFYILQKLPLVINRESFPLLYFYISQLFQEFREKKPLYHRVVHGLGVALCAELNRLTLSGTLSGSIQTDSENSYLYVRTALAYIYEHYTEEISIRELAAHCCISESHFRRVFKTIVGISPLDYIQHYRIQQACHLIYLNQEPINLIALRVGYRSLSSFNRQFQQYMHSSPTQYRREHLHAPAQNEIRSYEDNRTKHIFQI